MTKIKVDKKDSFYESVRLDKSTIATATLCLGACFPGSATYALSLYGFLVDDEGYWPKCILWRLHNI